MDEALVTVPPETSAIFVEKLALAKVKLAILVAALPELDIILAAKLALLTVS